MIAGRFARGTSAYHRTSQHNGLRPEGARGTLDRAERKSPAPCTRYRGAICFYVLFPVVCARFPRANRPVNIRCPSGTEYHWLTQMVPALIREEAIWGI